MVKTVSKVLIVSLAFVVVPVWLVRYSAYEWLAWVSFWGGWVLFLVWFPKLPYQDGK